MSRSVLFAVCLVLAACTPPGARNPAHLAARLFQAPSIELVVAADLSDAERAECERVAERWTLGRNAARRAFPTRVTPTSSSDVPRVVIGRPGSDVVAPLLVKLGVELLPEGGFRYLDRDFGKEQVLVATFEDPTRPGWPVTVVAAGDPLQLAVRLRLLEPVGWPGARTFRDGEPVFELRLGLDGSPARATLTDFAAARRELAGSTRRWPDSPAGLDVLATQGIGGGNAAEVVAAAAATRERAREMLGGEAFDRRGLVLLSRAGDMLALHGRVELATAQPHGSSTMLVIPGLAHDAGAALASAELVARLGLPTDAWLAEAAGVELADGYWGRSLVEWGAHLVDAELLPGAQALVDPTADARLSPHVLVPGRALLVRYLRSRMGDEGLVAWWTGAFGAELEREEQAARRARELEGFEFWLASLLQPAVEGARARRDFVRSEFVAATTRRGVALDSAPNPGGILANARIEATLRQARGLGADAVSQIAYFSEHPAEQRFAARLTPPRIGPEEGDAAVAAVLGRARVQEMRTMLRPVMLVSDAGSYSGWS